MYKILCLTTGSEIKWPVYWTKQHLIQKLVPSEIQDGMEDSDAHGCIMLFKSEKAASWFICRRLSYNPKRTDVTKLHFMCQVFQASDIDFELFTKKHMFEIVEV